MIEIVGWIVILVLAYFLIWKGLGSLLRAVLSTEGAKRCHLCSPHFKALIRSEAEFGRHSVQFQFLERAMQYHFQEHHPFGRKHRCYSVLPCCL